MNLLLFERAEFELTKPMLFVTGDRAEHMIRVQKVMPGRTVRVGEFDGPRGTGIVREVTPGKVALEIALEDFTELPADVDLILAMPRPQTLKKVLQTTATMGVRRLVLIGAERVEKSFFDSPLLKQDKIRHYLTLGLEQGVSTLAPRVDVLPRFHEFLAEKLPEMLSETDLALVSHPGAVRTLADTDVQELLLPETRVLFAIGPEGGWRPQEVEAFAKQGFVVFSFGRRILRVETAVCACLAQLDLLRQMQTRTFCQREKTQAAASR